MAFVTDKESLLHAYTVCYYHLLDEGEDVSSIPPVSRAWHYSEGQLLGLLLSTGRLVACLE